MRTSEGKHLLFLKKKKQKDFFSMVHRGASLCASHQYAKVFWFFFSKKNPSLYLIAWES